MDENEFEKKLYFSSEERKNEDDIEKKYSKEEIERMKENWKGTHSYSTLEAVPLKYIYFDLKTKLPEHFEKIIEQEYGTGFLKQPPYANNGGQRICNQSKPIKLESHFQHAGDSFSQECCSSGINFSSKF